MSTVDVIVREVGLRDGLQIHPTFMPTERKLAWIRAEAAAGVPEIEVTSYVPPKLIPQFADAEHVTIFQRTPPYSVPVADVVQHAVQLAEAGADESVVPDTVGYADPAQVRAVFKAVIAAVGSVPVAAHFHDTRGIGLANVTAALDCGVRRFDASLAGIGGCPFAPGATGNIGPPGAR